LPLRTGQFQAECSDRSQVWKSIQTFRPFLPTSRAPGITKNDSSSTAPEAVSRPINGCAAQDSWQLLMFVRAKVAHMVGHLPLREKSLLRTLAICKYIPATFLVRR